MDREIGYLLTRADLANYADNFKQIGVAKVEHFLDVDDNTLEQDIGLTKIQVRRLRRFFVEIQGTSKNRDSHSDGKYFTTNNQFISFHKGLHRNSIGKSHSLTR